jgi:ubiquinone/menaquinone biosynthesis C-methylase UbiE
MVLSMNDYYTGWRARYYNLFWGTFSRRTLEAAEAMIDLTSLLTVSQRLGRAPLVPTKHIVGLDVACGTGILLKWLLEQVPGLEAYGVDASQDMLTQASAALKQWPHVHLECKQLGTDQMDSLPFQAQSFDLITCTNAFHYLPDPLATLSGLARLLAPSGQLVLEDYHERQLILISSIFKWLVRRFDPKHLRTYTLSEVHDLCTRAGLSIVAEKSFPIDWLCDGWTLRARML